MIADKDSITEYVSKIYNVFCTILFNLITIALARICITSVWNCWRRFIIEFVIIFIPTLASLNVFNGYIVNLITTVGVLMFMYTIWRNANSECIKKNNFKFGRRPQLITLLRSSVNSLTALCILAVDFQSFPKDFRKSRSFGVGLMDMGIGLYVFSMGLVSQRLKKIGDLQKVALVVGCLLILGTTRTTVITLTNYHQDEHEYGVHLNSFFILGFTKLLGALISALAKKDNQLLILAIGIAVIHEITLQCGISDFVMNDEISRDNLLSANREGLSSMLGFISIYLIALHIGIKLKSSENLTFPEILSKVKALGLASVISWYLVLLCIYTVGIARVTCNFGYIVWISGTAFTVLLLFLLVFDIFLDTFCPIVYFKNAYFKITDMHLNIKIPLIIESINYNSLSYFLFANFLTGLVNIYLVPEDKSDIESFMLLLTYLFIINFVVFILYLFKIRIA